MATVWALIVFQVIGSTNAVTFTLALCMTMIGVGMIYGPVGSYVPELFATRYRYTGAGVAYSLAGILGGSIPPVVAATLAANYGTGSIGIYLGVMGVISLVCVSLIEQEPSCRAGRRHVDGAGRGCLSQFLSPVGQAGPPPVAGLPGCRGSGSGRGDQRGVLTPVPRLDDAPEDQRQLPLHVGLQREGPLEVPVLEGPGVGQQEQVVRRELDVGHHEEQPASTPSRSAARSGSLVCTSRSLIRARPASSRLLVSR